MKNLIFVLVLSIVFFSTQNTHAQLFDKIKKETEKVIQKETQKPPEVKKETPPTTEEKNNTETKESANTNKTSEETTSQKPQLCTAEIQRGQVTVGRLECFGERCCSSFCDPIACNLSAVC